MTYKCDVCKLEYDEEKLAKECYAWCSTHNSCNFLIARQAINKEQAKAMSPSDDERYKESG
jgi:hypothetical protein